MHIHVRGCVCVHVCVCVLSEYVCVRCFFISYFVLIAFNKPALGMVLYFF